jgi:hypothetical protein
MHKHARYNLPILKIGIFRKPHRQQREHAIFNTGDLTNPKHNNINNDQYFNCTRELAHLKISVR